MNNPFKSRLVRLLIEGWSFAVVMAAILTILSVYVNRKPVEVKNPVLNFQLNTNWNTNTYFVVPTPDPTTAIIKP